MKALKLFALASGCVGLIIVILGSLSFILRNNFLHVGSITNIFLVSDSFFLITIAILIYMRINQSKD